MISIRSISGMPSLPHAEPVITTRTPLRRSDAAPVPIGCGRRSIDSVVLDLGDHSPAPAGA
jgi:hypothetical protein